MKQIIYRAKSPTPKFFKILRNIGLVLTGVSTVIVTATVSLPAAVVAAAGYMAVAAGVLSAVSQINVESE